MPDFSYKAKNMAGEIFTGSLSVSSKQEVNDFLDQQEYFPIEIKEQKDKTDNINFFDRFQKVSSSDIANFTKQVATLIHAGVPIVSALEALHDQTDDEKFRGIIGSLIAEVSAGVSF